MRQEGALRRPWGCHTQEQTDSRQVDDPGRMVQEREGKEGVPPHPVEEGSELAGRVEPLAALGGSVPHVSLDASCQGGHI